ncbi:MAG: TIGR03087 family PEP-CTERM/XrtA system glycosyltransferase [Acetobacteraceae bacterium]|nr:TIGR03087 family PEP-CTERM/XrtA system glycosyltransferase [Acetobacteraceae bacterium]
MSRPNLLFLTQRLPYPPIKGEKIRPLQILHYLRQWYDVHLGCLIDDPADWQHADTIRALCRDTHIAGMNPKLARLLCLRGLLTGESLSVVFFRDRGLQAWVRQVVERVRPEVVFVNSSNMAPYVLDLPRTGMRVVDLADVDSEKWRAYADAARGPMRWVYRREWRCVAALERRIAEECDLASFVSDAEAALFTALAPARAHKIRGVSSGVDFRYFDPAPGYPAVYNAALPTFVFTGTMDYPPNVDAVTWFATDLLPLIRQRHAEARFYVVGANPVPAVQALARLPGVHVTGRVPDVRPYLAHATAGVAPMRIARGIQNKVLEAMAMGKAVIATPGALEGIEAEPGRDLILAQDATGIAAAACRMIEQPGEAAAIGTAARRLVVERYDWPVRLARYDDILRPGARA